MTAPVKPDPAAKRKLMAAARAASRALPHGLPPVFFMTDPARTPDPAAIAKRLPRGWGVIYRHFGAQDRRGTALKLTRMARRRRLVLLVAADLGLARTARADGVHLPERATSRSIGSRRLTTAAAHSRAAVQRARRMGADAAILSTVFPSASPSAGAPMGALKFRIAAMRGGMPLYALGGVTARNAGRISRYGGFAAIGSISEVFGGGSPKT
ncbi:MAG: thiamine phosphate synthase [Pseudomonadota bacterium]